MANNDAKLDYDGLLYFKNKMMTKIPTKTSSLENDSGFITTGDIPEGAAASTTTPKMAGTATIGTELAFARGDHVHPSDNSKVDKVSGKQLSTEDFTTALKTKLESFGAADTYAKKSDIASLYKFKGSKATYEALPSNGNAVGDVWDVEASGMNYVWTGTAWDALGQVFTIERITNEQIDGLFAST